MIHIQWPLQYSPSHHKFMAIMKSFWIHSPRNQNLKQTKKLMHCWGKLILIFPARLIVMEIYWTYSWVTNVSSTRSPPPPPTHLLKLELQLICAVVCYNANNSLIFLEAPGANALKICRMDKYGGCCTGNEEVFLLCERVQKGQVYKKIKKSNMLLHYKIPAPWLSEIW